MGDDIRAQCRYVARRVRRMAPDVRIVAFLLNDMGSSETAETLHIDHVTRNFDSVAELVSRDSLSGQVSSDPVRINPFAGGGRGSDSLGRALDAIAEWFNVPAAIINLVDDQRHFDDEEAARLTLLVAESEQTLIVHSDQANPLVGESAYLQTSGIDLYAGVPLIMPDGTCPGVLALIDYEEHPFSAADAQSLVAAAGELVAKFGSASRPNTRGMRSVSSTG